MPQLMQGRAVKPIRRLELLALRHRDPILCHGVKGPVAGTVEDRHPGMGHDLLGRRVPFPLCQG